MCLCWELFVVKFLEQVTLHNPCTEWRKYVPCHSCRMSLKVQRIYPFTLWRRQTLSAKYAEFVVPLHIHLSIPGWIRLEYGTTNNLLCERIPLFGNLCKMCRQMWKRENTILYATNGQSMAEITIRLGGTGIITICIQDRRRTQNSRQHQTETINTLIVDFEKS